MAAQNQGLLQPHELTGTTEGTKSRFLSNLIQAVPSVGAAIATGGTAGLILGAAQSAGSTYTDLLQNHIMAGDSIEEAHKKAAGTAIASGAVGLALSKLMPGGAQALNNPATKKAFSSTVKSFAKGGAEEFSQEAIDGAFTHIASEMNKGKTFNEAATSFAEQFPQSALTSALLGGGIETAADHRQTSNPTPQQLPPQQPTPANPPTQQQQQQQPAPANPPASAPQQPPSPTPAQQPIPQATTPGAGASGSGQQSQTTANNRQQPQTPSPSGSSQQSSTTVNFPLRFRSTTANHSKRPPTTANSPSLRLCSTTANRSKQ